MKTQMKNYVPFIAMAVVLAFAKVCVSPKRPDASILSRQPSVGFEAKKCNCCQARLFLTRHSGTPVGLAPVRDTFTVPVSTQVMPNTAGIYDFPASNWKDNCP